MYTEMQGYHDYIKYFLPTEKGNCYCIKEILKEEEYVRFQQEVKEKGKIF